VAKEPAQISHSRAVERPLAPFRGETAEYGNPIQIAQLAGLAEHGEFPEVTKICTPIDTHNNILAAATERSVSGEDYNDWSGEHSMGHDESGP